MDKLPQIVHGQRKEQTDTHKKQIDNKEAKTVCSPGWLVGLLKHKKLRMDSFILTKGNKKHD